MKKITRLGMFIPEFPTQTHVFFWREIEALRELGLAVSIISTKRPLDKCPHEFAAQALSEAHYVFPPSWGAIAYLLTRPKGVWSCLGYIGRMSGGVRRKLQACGLMLCAADMAMHAKRQGLEHVHVHSCADAAHIASMANLLGMPSFSLHLHGDLPVYGIDHHLKTARASFVAAAAAPMRQQLIDSAGVAESRALTLWMGVNTQLFQGGARLAQAGEPLLLVSIGRLHLCKGHKFALEAIKKLISHGHAIHYTIAGSGPHEAEIRASVEELGLNSAVSFVGSLGETQVKALLHKSDVFVLTSIGIGEASPVAVMEAMSAGLPVISSIIGGTPDMVSDGRDGFLVPQEDVGAIFKAIEALANESRRLELGRNALQRARTQFDFRQTSKKLLAAIEAA